MQFNFTRMMSFFGRNGQFNSTGLKIWTGSNKNVYIEPITSKGAVGRCFLETPAEDIPALIKLLQAEQGLAQEGDE